MKKEIVMRKELLDLVGDSLTELNGRKCVINEKGEAVPVRGNLDVSTLSPDEYAALREFADDDDGFGGGGK